MPETKKELIKKINIIQNYMNSLESCTTEEFIALIKLYCIDASNLEQHNDSKTLDAFNNIFFQRIDKVLGLVQDKSDVRNELQKYARGTSLTPTSDNIITMVTAIFESNLDSMGGVIRRFSPDLPVSAEVRPRVDSDMLSKDDPDLFLKIVGKLPESLSIKSYWERIVGADKSVRDELRELGRYYRIAKKTPVKDLQKLITLAAKDDPQELINFAKKAMEQESVKMKFIKQGPGIRNTNYCL